MAAPKPDRTPGEKSKSKESCTLLVTNMHPDTTSQELENHFSNLGPVKRCFVVKKKGVTTPSISGYVTYAMSEDAQAAVSQLTGSKLGDNDIKVKLAPPKPPYQHNKPKTTPTKSNSATVNDDLTAPSPVLSEKEEKPGPFLRHQQNLPRKKARIVVRNLSFKANEEQLKEYFSKVGPVTEVKILAYPDGKKKGVAFVQFDKVPDAANAIKACNAKPFMGRPVAVDWAVPKDQYQQTVKPDREEVTVKEEPLSDEEDEIKEEDSDSDQDIKEEDDSEDEDLEEEDSDRDSGVKIENSDEDDMDDEDEDEDSETEAKRDKPSDVNEGKTVFIRNLPFDATEEDMKARLSDFGPIAYAVLCMDHLMERPKGTGFVKFKDATSAEKCVEESETGSGVLIKGRRVQVHVAVSRETLDEQFKRQKEPDNKDKRNLFLAREGLIRPGTLAAQGVSAADMAKRQTRETIKRQLLQNFHNFISRERLCIHNLPASYSDAELRALFKKHAPKGADITEARVMRDMKKLGPGNVPLSKEFGFVTFSKHEDALHALRSLNNNPGVFSKDKRPIVEFSVENRAALLARERRLQKSKEKWQKPAPKDSKSSGNASKTSVASISDEPLPEFAGSKADPKVKNLPTHAGPKVRHKKRQPAAPEAEEGEKAPKKPKITRKSLKNPRPKRAAPEEFNIPVQSYGGAPKAKKQKRAKMSDGKFDRMVQSYKNELGRASEPAKKKWFDGD